MTGGPSDAGAPHDGVPNGGPSSGGVPAAGFPTGEQLEQAVVEARAGRLDGAAFAAVLTDSTLLLAVLDRSSGDPGTDAVSPVVIDVDGVAYGVTFTSPRRFDTFRDRTPFVLLAGAEFGRSWPAGLGLALNPGTTPTMLIAPDQLAGLMDTRSDTDDNSGNAGYEKSTDDIPAGSAITMGAPDPGLPPTALDLLQRLVRSDPDVLAAYQLAVGVGDRAPELVVGVEPSEPKARTAQHFAARVMDADEGFRGLAFLDLDGDLLRMARRSSPPLT